MARSLKKNFGYNVAYQALLVIVPFVTIPYLARVLGPDGVGVYSYTFSITNYFVLVATLGMSTYGVRLIAQAGKDIEKQSIAFWSAFISQCIVGLFVICAYGLYVFTLHEGGYVICLVWGLWILSAVIDPSWYFFGIEEFKLPTVINCSTKIASVVCIFLFVKSEADLWCYVAIIASSYLINQLLLWCFVPRHVGWAKPSAREIRKHFWPNFRLFIPVIAISMYVLLDKVMLGAIAGMTQTGYYEYSEKLSKFPLALITAMGTIMLPRMSALLAANDHREALVLLNRSIYVMLAAAMGLSFAIAAIAPEFCPIFFGPEYYDCIVLMMLMTVVIPIITTTNVVGRQWLIPLGRDGAYTLSVCAGGIVNVCVNLVLIPRLGAMGAVVGTICAELTVLIVQVFAVRNELPFVNYIKNALPYLFFGLGMFVVVRVIAGIANGWWGLSIQGLLLEILAGGMFFAITAGGFLFLRRSFKPVG